MKSSTPACSAMLAAVSGLSPVTMTVRRPIFRSRSKRSRMPGLRMSSSTTTPDDAVALARPAAASRPCAATASTCSCDPRRHRAALLPGRSAITASGAPLRMRRPSGRSTPLIRVWAVNATNSASRGSDARSTGRFVRRGLLAVQLDDALALGRLVGDARRARRELADLERGELARRERTRVAWRLPIVIVPVLSSSSVSTSPATSTALPLLAMMFARSARSMPAMPMAASSAPIVVGIRQTSSATSVGTSVPRLLQRLRTPEVVRHVLLGVPGHRPERHDDDQEDQRERRQHERQRDLVRACAAGWRPSTSAIMRSRNDSPGLRR